MKGGQPMKEQIEIEELTAELIKTNSYGTLNAVAEHLYNADYRKQKEGEWIDKPTGAYSRMQSWCSACGKHSGIGGIESNRHKPFCPNCGAKMRGGKNE
jgi:hypothetical protein